MRAVSPDGSEIVGTLEIVPGTANILPHSFTKDAKGELEFEYSGQTDIEWDSQTTQNDEKGERLFVDENGGTWPESQLTLSEDDEEDDAAEDQPAVSSADLAMAVDVFSDVEPGDDLLIGTMTLQAFFDANADGIDAEEQADIVQALRDEGRYAGGGGSAPRWVVQKALK